MPERSDDADQEHHWQSAASGLRMLWNNRIMRILVVASAHFNLFTSMFFALYTLYAIRTLHFSPFLFGVITMAGGVAGLFAATITTRIATRFGSGHILIAGFAFPGIIGLLVPAAASFDKPAAAALLVVSSFFWSFCVVILLIISVTVQQRVVPDEFMGRVSAAFRFIAWGIEPLGALLGGFLGSSALGVRGTMTLAAAGIVPSALWVLFSSVRGMTEPAPNPEDQALPTPASAA
jgi:predicted MFS family arabinose efflux permease